jgi:hypothetical protein
MGSGEVRGICEIVTPREFVIETTVDIEEVLNGITACDGPILVQCNCANAINEAATS